MQCDLRKEGEKMNVYDTANQLAQEIRQSEEYVNFKMAREAIKLNQKKMKHVQELYAELIEQPDAKRYFEAETKFNILIADVNKMIGEAIKDVME